MQNRISSDLMNAVEKLLSEIMLTKEGEQVVITVDAIGDEAVARATAEAASSLGAVPTLILYPTQPEAQMEPPHPLAAAVAQADVWIEYAVQYILYTDARQRASSAGCRYACMSGMDADMCIRTIGNVNQSTLLSLGDELVGLFSDTQEIRVASREGTEIKAILTGEANQSGGIADQDGALVMLGGQVCHLPHLESIEGRIVVDGVIWPPHELGVLSEMVGVEVAQGSIVSTDGGKDALRYWEWLNSFEDPELLKMAHYCYGFNPGVQKPAGRIVEDERVFGALTFGFGSTPARKVATHSDCVVLRPTIILDGEEIERDGVYVQADLRQLCIELGVRGY